MRRLTLYLIRTFARDALGLIIVIGGLLWIVQCLRIFDVVTVKGQGVTTLAGLAALGLPPMLLAFFYAAMAIGLGRGLRTMASRQELQIIHAAGETRSLFTATLGFAAIGAVIAIGVAMFIAPLSERNLNTWSANVAADLVGRTLKPHQFTQVSPGVVVLIGGRLNDGQITDFFADDRRDSEERRIYVAQSAVIAADDQSYVLRLSEGRLQYSSNGITLSEVEFGQYDIAFDRLAGAAEAVDPITEMLAPELIATAAGGDLALRAQAEIVERLAQGLKVFALCLLVLAVAGFPTGKRSRWRLPLEVGVLLVALVETAAGLLIPLPPFIGPLLFPAVMFAAALALYGWRMRRRRMPQLALVPA
ncbi:MAG: LptF/LptG family permease [Devosia sp.]|nr:LptF/LptG family permease [Devosia sp.]